jgi:ABC-type multidrug transport system fused ATPase/permease subunit
VGVPAVLSGRLSGTELAVITLIPLAAFELVVGLPVATQSLQRVRQAAGRVFEVLDAPAPVPDPENAAPLRGPPHDIELESVWAGYPGAPSPAVADVTLSLPFGRRVAVVGPSGAGKSTLAALLVGFLRCGSGSITVSGVPTEQLPGDDLRTVVGLVGQDAYLFDTTVADNLRVGRRDATDDQLRRVLDRVGLTAWLDDLPLGLATEVGHHGVRVSGGQRQRLVVARALLADFPVLVLDEPAEHLDPTAADPLTSDLLDVTAGRSLVLITHRLTGLETVDEIIVMESGRVVERGTHDELLCRPGRYADLWWAEMRTVLQARSPEEPTHHRQRPPPTARSP